jgi:hypothetical protein|tara:strand:- start:1662 stop:1892 length:231 start_codon:yes stop_codon:yes gene_type:complete
MMAHIYNVIREWSQDNGTQVNTLAVFTDLSDAEDAADEAARYGGSDEDRGYVEIVKYELNPERVGWMNDAGTRQGR